MKRIVYLALAVLACACSSGSNSTQPQGNPYLGRIPSIQRDDSNAYEASRNNPGDYSYEDVRQKYADALDAELKRLTGVVAPCISGMSDMFTVVGNKAVFYDNCYHVLLHFTQDVSFYGDPVVQVLFCNSEQEGIAAYGMETQILFRRSGLEDGWRAYRISDYPKDEFLLWSFYVNSIQFEDADALEENFNLVALAPVKDHIMACTTKLNPSKAPYPLPETWAVVYQEAFYQAAQDNDTEKFCELDTELGEYDGFSDEELKYFFQGYGLWKALFPEKWSVIKGFRQNLINDGYALAFPDVDDFEM